MRKAERKQKKIVKLSDFAWEGLDSRRNKNSGELSAHNTNEARLLLRKQGIHVTKIRRKSKPLFSAKSIKAVDISFASRQIATMIGAGIPIAQAIQGISRGHDNASMRKLMKAIQIDVETGNSLSQALGKHPKHFNRLYTSLVAAGEESGKLDIMLDRIATYQEKIEAIKSKVKSALMYPIVVLSTAVIVIIVMLIFVIPSFEKMFKSFGSELPTLTQMMVQTSHWVSANWWIAFAIGIGGSLAFSFMYRRSDNFKYTMDRLNLKIPIIGGIVNKSAIARFARTQAIMFGAGVPLVDSLNTVASATGNRVYERAVNKIKRDVSTGISFERAMYQTKIFPHMVMQMVASGEESGELETMLEKVADFYEGQVDDAVEGLASLIEPIMIVLLGGIIGTMVLAMYLPIFKMASVF